MSKEDVIYAAVLIGSVFCGKFLCLLQTPTQKKLFCAATGVATVTAICQLNGLHSLLVALVNSFIITRAPKRICHVISFAWCFVYLGFFRTVEHFGLPAVSPLDNVVQLFITLRLVGLAFEVCDSDSNLKRLKKESGKEGTKNEDLEDIRLKCKYQNVEPSLLDSLLYCYCYIGIFTGPYFKYRTYHDMIYSKNVNTRTANSQRWTILVSKLRLLPLYAFGYFILSQCVTVQTAKSDEFHATQPLWFRALYTLPLFMGFRFRLYIAFVLSECSCIAAKLGAYPVFCKSKPGEGPTDYSAIEHQDTEPFGDSSQSIDFETISNIEVWKCEFAPTMRESIKAWNKTIQYWLAANVYKRLTSVSQLYRTVVTMAVSAFWHGVHPGYYLTFLTVPFYLVAEDLLLGTLRRRGVGHLGNSPLWYWTSWFLRMRSSEYIGLGFHLLGFHETIFYWKELFFLGHILILVAIIVGIVLQFLVHKKIESREEKDYKVKNNFQN